MENEKIARINEFLARHGASVDTISKQKTAQLLKVDEAIQARLAEITKAQEILRGKPINLSVIATDTGIARKTFYNNDLLRMFIEEHSYSNDKTASASERERLKDRCEELEQQVRMFLLRDIETENLRHENMKLQAEIQNLQSRNATLEERYEQLQEDYTNLKHQPQNNAIILPFGKPN